MSRFLQNLNSNMLCAVAIEPTGPDPFNYDMLEIAVVPLDDYLRPSKKIIPFFMELKPKRKDNTDKNYLRVNRERLCSIIVKGIEYGAGAEFFAEWFERLKLKPNKGIIPLTYDWPFVRPFIYDWLGPLTFDMCFHYEFRDILSTTLLCNDRAGWMGQDFPYPKLDIGYITSQLKIEYQRPYDVINDARTYAEIYGRIVKEYL